MPPPGFVRGASAEATPGRWYVGNNIRWRGGVMEPVGGNQLIPGITLTEPPVDMITWHDNLYRRWAAFGTTSKLYAYNFNSKAFYDITPTDLSGTIIHPDPATTSGYGNGVYGAGLYGMPRSDPSAPPPGIVTKIGDWWSMDTFGENLMCVPTMDGRLFEWMPSAPTTKATVVSGAPFGNRGVIVTDQRQVVLYGSDGDPRRVAWSDVEDPTMWVEDITNLAGSKQLQTQGYAMCALRMPQGILIFTSNDVHLMSYVGPPYAYGINIIATGCGPVSLRAPVAAGPLAAWPSWQNFWTYGGTVTPLQCDLKDYFFGNVNQTAANSIFGSCNPQFGEFWWDWPDLGALANNKYIAFNYAPTMAAERTWLMGERVRSCGDRIGVMDYPVLGGPGPGGTGGALYQHEIGFLDNGVDRAANGRVYAESGNIVLGDGDHRYDVSQIVVDGQTNPANPAFGFRFYPREEPLDVLSERDTGLYSAVHGGLIDIRFSGRSTRMRVEAIRDITWSVGRTRLQMRQAGLR